MKNKVDKAILVVLLIGCFAIHCLLLVVASGALK